jgi:hypothetical protein
MVCVAENVPAYDNPDCPRYQSISFAEPMNFIQNWGMRLSAMGSKFEFVRCWTGHRCVDFGLTGSAKRLRLENRRRCEEQMPSALLFSSTLSKRGVRGC